MRCHGDCSSHLHRVPRDEDVLLVDVQVDVGDGGEVGRAPLIKVGDELEGEVGQLVAVGGQDEGAGGGKAQRRAVEGPEDAAARAHAVLGASREAAPHAVAERALLLRLAAPGVTLDQVSADAAAALGAVGVPEQLLGLKGSRAEASKPSGSSLIYRELLAWLLLTEKLLWKPTRTAPFESFCPGV